MDQRATLYWNPYLITDQTGILEIEFYTNDTEELKMVVIEGMGIDGKPVKGSYLIMTGK